jgi:septal ring factor EnvC (AmiA/AmiB activator)
VQEIDQFIINHFNMAAGIFVILAGFLKLAWDSKSNGTKLDTLLTKNDTMSTSQHQMQLELSKSSLQIAGVAKDVGEIKNDTRSHDKEISIINARLAALENQRRQTNE